MDNFVVYAYCREDGTFYYIGKGSRKRAYGKRKKGVKPPTDRNRILLLHTGLSEQTAFDYEVKLILFYGRKDLGTGPLRNMTDGGEGVAGLIRDEEWRRKKSESMRGEGNPHYKDGRSLRPKDKKPRKSLTEEYKSSPKYKEDRRRNAEITNKQVWESTVDGFRSTSGNVAKHNKAKGWDPNARVKIP